MAEHILKTLEQLDPELLKLVQDTQQYIKAEMLEQASWQAISEVLERPEIVIAELRRHQVEAVPF